MSLVYQLFSESKDYSYIGFTDNPNTIKEQFPNRNLEDFTILRPLEAFSGDRGQELVKKWVEKLNVIITKEREYSFVIYKIQCNDPSITDVYIGQTVDFNQRVFAHCEDVEVKDTKVYSFIKNHGGIQNWSFTILGKYDGSESDRLEWYWWKKYSATLNSVTPGIRFLIQDMKKLHFTEDQMVHVYEILEYCSHVDSQIKFPFNLWKPKILYLDCNPPKEPEIIKSFSTVYPLLSTKAPSTPCVKTWSSSTNNHIYEIICGEIRFLGFMIGEEVTKKSILKKLKSNRSCLRTLKYIKDNWEFNIIKSSKSESLLSEYSELLKNSLSIFLSKEQLEKLITNNNK
jgi:hypothetical protein